MGSCLSKKNDHAKEPEDAVTVPVQRLGFDVVNVDKEEVKKMKKQAAEGEGPLQKREIFVIKHRRSHERERDVSPLGCSGSNNGSVPAREAFSGGTVRTSSCTREDLDAILIQCGRLSRNNSSGKAGVSGSRNYSGSKRSCDFDQSLEAGGSAGEYVGVKDDDDGGDGGETRQDRSRHRQSSRQQQSGSPQGRRRRTPSRERNQRSGSRERGISGSGRRVSRSPGRRSESNSNTNVEDIGTNSIIRPVKLVSVPATVSSLAIGKSNSVSESSAIKRISVKRNVGENAAAVAGSTATTRSSASPRSISPARVNARAANESNNQQQPPSLSRNSSRKAAEHSPYRRNPLAEIDPNSLVYPQAVGNKSTPANANHFSNFNKGLVQKPTTENNYRIVAPAGDESSRPQTVTRSRSTRRSRELDINPDCLLNHTPSYTALLLEDIQNFHQKNVHVPVPAPAFQLPSCLSKARSILEAVADLNSTTSSVLSSTLSEGKRNEAAVGANLVGKKLLEIKDPFVESEALARDDLMEPSVFKYVTLRRGGTDPVEDMEELESSGSNNYIGWSSSQQQWANSTSSWEPNSADSTDRWTSKSNTTRDEDSEQRNPAGSQRIDRKVSANRTEENRKGLSGQKSGIGHGRGGVGKNLQPVPRTTNAAST